MKKCKINSLHTIHKKSYVISEDIDILLFEWAKSNNFSIPSAHFFSSLRGEMKEFLQKIFKDVDFINGNMIKKHITELVDKTSDIVVSLDKVYYSNNCCLTLEVTRMVDKNLSFIGNASRSKETIDEQIDAILKSVGDSVVVIIDDVVFSGENLIDIISRMENKGISTSSIVIGVSIGEGIELIREKFPYVSIYSVFHYDNVIDEICERDFYPGVQFSGRLIGKKDVNGIPRPLPLKTGVPYLFPFADFKHISSWASIPEKYAKKWSRFCVEQNIKLWSEIERISEKKVLCSHIERIPTSFPYDDSSFVNQLRRSLHLV